VDNREIKLKGIMKYFKNKTGLTFTLLISGLVFSCAEKRDLKGTLSFVLSANVRAQFDPCG